MAMKNKRARFSQARFALKRRMRAKSEWWDIHVLAMMTKDTAYASNCGKAATKASSTWSAGIPSGSFRSRARRVRAMAKTASLKNTIRSRDVPDFNGSHPHSFGGAPSSSREVAHRLHRGAVQDEGRPAHPPQGRDG